MGKLVNEPGKFQSTLPRRERHDYVLQRYAWQRYFNPRSREGSDSKPGEGTDTDNPFQSTLP